MASPRKPPVAPERTRMDALVRFSDLCTEAKGIADEFGETFLAYMTAMTIQAARMEMLPTVVRHTTSFRALGISTPDAG